MRRDPAYAMSENYVLKIPMFENGKPEEFLKMMKNFETALNGTGTTSTAGKINYLRNLLRGESLQEFDYLTSQATSTTNAHLTLTKEGLLAYFFQSTLLPSRSAWWDMPCVKLKIPPWYYLPHNWCNSTTTYRYSPGQAFTKIWRQKN